MTFEELKAEIAKYLDEHEDNQDALATFHDDIGDVVTVVGAQVEALRDLARARERVREARSDLKKKRG